MEKNLLASASYDQSIRLWDMGTGAQLYSLAHSESQVNAMAMTVTGSHLAVGGWQRVRLFDLHSMSPTPILVYENLARNVTAVGFQSDCRWMFTGGEDCVCRVYDLRGGTQLNCQRLLDIPAPVQSVVLHPNQVELFISDSAGGVHCWDLKADALERVSCDLSPNNFVTKLSVHPQGNLLAGVTNRGHLLRWNLNVGEDEDACVLGEGDGSRTSKPTPFQAHSTYALSCRFSPNGEYLITTSAEDVVRFFSGKSNRLQREMTGAGTWVWDTAWTNDSRHLVCANAEGGIKLFAVDSLTPKLAYTGHNKPITAICARDDV